LNRAVYTVFRENQRAKHPYCWENTKRKAKYKKRKIKNKKEKQTKTKKKNKSIKIKIGKNPKERGII